MFSFSTDLGTVPIKIENDVGWACVTHLRGNLMQDALHGIKRVTVDAVM
jgi:hypothetical protein